MDKRLIGILSLGVLLAVSLFGRVIAATPATNSPDAAWDSLRQQVDLLDKIAYLPSLLPIIMKHRDMLELSDDQIASFRGWHRLYYQDMVDLMNEIIQRRITLSQATLDDQVTAEDILSQQKEIFQLQERLLRIRLTCRNLIIGTFSAEQWENFAFILEEYPRYAGLLEN